MTEAWQEYVDRTAARLAAAGIDPAECRLEARVLIAAALGMTREQMVLRRAAPSDSETAQVETLIERRERREPLAYILGNRWFYGLEFAVGPGVLVPRPETELLVEWVLEQFPQDTSAHIADVGTGSGCIAVAIAKHRPNIRVDAIDVSSAALEQARANAIRHDVAERIHFRHADLFGNVAPGTVYDAVVSNPPYIPESERPQLAPEVAAFEPSAALFGPESDGLGLYRRLAMEAPRFLHPAASIAVEVGAGQAPAVEAILAASGWTAPDRIPDLAGIERVVTAVVGKSEMGRSAGSLTDRVAGPHCENKESA